MSTYSSRPPQMRSWRRRSAATSITMSGAIAALIAIAALAIAAPASAASASGEVKLSLKGGADSLAGLGVKAAIRNGSKDSIRGPGSKAVKLTVADLELPGATVRTSGSLLLTAGGRTAALTGVTLQVGKSSTAVSAKLGKKRLVLFRAKGAATIEAFSVKLDGAALSLTGKGAKALRERLGLDSLAAGPSGTAAVNAQIKLSLGNDVVPPPAKPVEPVDPYPYAKECPVPKGTNPVGPGTAGAPAPAPTFNPGTSQEVTGTSVDWGFKDAFRAYVIGLPPGGSTIAVEGAGEHPAGGSMAAPGSFFDFPMTTGTYEPGAEPNHSDDKLVANGTGAALLCKPGHGFNIVVKNPTVIIDGENSRITADLGVNNKGTWFGVQRVDVAELDLSLVEPDIADGGNTIVWEDIPATLTDAGAVAGGLLAFYQEGEPLDPITVETSLNRPLLAECGIDAGIADAPPEVDFTLADLPTLTNPVTGTGGTINWGFRRATRNTTTVTPPEDTPGSFQVLGGASEGYPGNMGGPAAPPPAGGQQKFFRFPVSSYQYEVGTPDPLDDRLIATSEATVGFCASQGNFGIVISKPTLVIDGANSRFVANAYSYSEANGWIGGRVDLVDLNTAAVAAVTETGTVRWGDVPPDNTPLVNGIPVDGGLATEAFKVASLEKGFGAGGFDPVSAQIVLPAP